MRINVKNETWRNRIESAGTEYSENAARSALAHLPEYAAMAGFTPDEQKQLAAEMDAVSKDPDLLKIWDVMSRTAADENTDFQIASADPEIDIDNEFAILLMVELACVPFMQELYRKKGWYDAAFGQALLDIRIWMKFCRDNYGKFGVAMMGHPWILVQMRGLVIRFGRLQCNTRSSFFNECVVYKHKAGGYLCPLLNTELDFNRDGLTAIDNDEIAFRSTKIAEDDQSVTGYAVSQRGVVSPRTITLAKSDWDVFLKPGDPVINLHIPADGPLKPDDCRDSFRKMLDFFRNVEHIEPKAFACESWLLDPMFQHVLQEDSNILAFQRFGYLIPWPGKSELVRRVYGVKAVEEGIDAVPHTTRMQKILAGYAKNGGKFRNGAFFFGVDSF